jgi:hypothetical protein
MHSDEYFSQFYWQPLLEQQLVNIGHSVPNKESHQDLSEMLVDSAAADIRLPKTAPELMPTRSLRKREVKQASKMN